MMERIGVLGSTGRTGQFVESALADAGLTCGAKVKRSDAASILENHAAILDFSSPEAVLEWSKKVVCPLWVIASTGWTEAQLATLKLQTQNAVVLRSGNFSLGVLLLQNLLREWSTELKRLGFEATLIETHHRHKKDAPSGTALLLKEALSPFSNLEIHSVRVGEVVGEHEVQFHGKSEILKLSHHALDRRIFAKGAVAAAGWALKEIKSGRLPPGHYPLQIFLDALRSNKNSLS